MLLDPRNEISDTPEARFRELVSTYYEGTLARKALRIVQRKQHYALGDLLIYHREYGIVSPDEIDVRAPIDALLRCYAIMEIAQIAGAIPAPDSGTFWQDGRLLLENPELTKYYMTSPAAKLSYLLLKRLQGFHSARVNDPEVLPLFAKFVKLDHVFMGTIEGSCFLRILDGFHVDGYSCHDVFSLLSHRDCSGDGVPSSSQQSNMGDEVLAGVRALTWFCLELHKVLNQLVQQPLLQSAIWSHYSYWLGSLGLRIQNGLNVILDERPLQILEEDGNPPAADSRDDLARARTAVIELTSHDYSSPVDSAFATVAGLV